MCGQTSEAVWSLILKSSQHMTKSSGICLREWSNVSAVPIEKDHPVASDCTNDMVNANQRSNGLHSVYFDVQTISTQTSP